MVSLQIQYLLVIKYGWNEKKVKGIEIFLHGIPIANGLGTAIAALVLKMYNPADWDCWIHSYPHDCTPTYVIRREEDSSDMVVTNCTRGDSAEIFQWAFFFVLLWAAIAFCVFVMMSIVRVVETTEKRTMRYVVNNPIDRDSEGQEQGRGARHQHLVMTEQVKRRGILYACGFLAVWIFPTITRLIELFNAEPPPLLNVFSGCFIASQGILNTMIYFSQKFRRIEQNHWWEKMWSLLKSELFFCCEWGGMQLH
mmetsp:Transcript_24113/g.50547  ORF Transcript_24113/g.50547 Transcript_24113/m.50547 type:complete len:253 (+) Transcript_24113:312-1070(+)